MARSWHGLPSIVKADREGVESFCQSVAANSLPAHDLDYFPLLCAYSLIQWVLDGKTQGEGYGFPFDRPYVVLAKRLLMLGERLEQIKMIHLRGEWRDNTPLLRLAGELKKISADRGLQKALAAVDLKIQVFDQLRRVMRIAEVGGSAGLNSGSDPIALGPIQKALTQFRTREGVKPLH